MFTCSGLVFSGTSRKPTPRAQFEPCPNPSSKASLNPPLDTPSAFPGRISCWRLARRCTCVCLDQIRLVGERFAALRSSSIDTLNKRGLGALSVCITINSEYGGVNLLGHSDQSLFHNNLLFGTLLASVSPIREGPLDE